MAFIKYDLLVLVRRGCEVLQESVAVMVCNKAVALALATCNSLWGACHEHDTYIFSRLACRCSSSPEWPSHPG